MSKLSPVSRKGGSARYEVHADEGSTRFLFRKKRKWVESGKE